MGRMKELAIKIEDIENLITGLWMCSCGQEVLSSRDDSPYPMKWSDGHVCSFRPVGPHPKDVRAVVKELKKYTPIQTVLEMQEVKRNPVIEHILK